MKDNKPVIKIKKKSFKAPLAIMACLMAMLMPNLKVLAQATQLAATPVPLPQDVALTAMVNEEVLPLKIAPDEKAETLFTYHSGTPLFITQETSDDWLKVQIWEGQGATSGYMKRSALTLTFMQEEKWDTSKMTEYTTTANSWTLYESPDKKSHAYTYGPMNTCFVLGSNEKWIHVMAVTPYSGEPILGFIPAANNMVPFTRGVVNNSDDDDRLHLRETPSAKGASKGKYYNGTQVFILNYEGKDEQWAKVMIPVSGENKGYQGYMNTAFLATGPARDSVKESFYIVKVDNPGDAANLKLRATPTDKGKTLATYPNGTQVEVMGLTESWYHVRVEDEVGFMLAKFLEPKIAFDYKK